MEHVRDGNRYTRRTALMMAVAAGPALAQTNNTGGKMAHPVVRFEIGCRDIPNTAAFYADLFGWKMGVNGPAATIDSGPGGIPGHMTSLGHEPLHYAMFYVEVEDVKAYLDKAVSLGGKVLVPPVKIPTGMFGWFADTEGNQIGLLQKA
jgi:predicted enzyme related to lactoylglutathione lyase